jgi:hypothetical protein
MSPHNRSANISPLSSLLSPQTEELDGSTDVGSEDEVSSAVSTEGECESGAERTGNYSAKGALRSRTVITNRGASQQRGRKLSLEAKVDDRQPYQPPRKDEPQRDDVTPETWQLQAVTEPSITVGDSDLVNAALG